MSRIWLWDKRDDQEVFDWVAGQSLDLIIPELYEDDGIRE